MKTGKTKHGFIAKLQSYTKCNLKKVNKKVPKKKSSQQILAPKLTKRKNSNNCNHNDRQLAMFFNLPNLKCPSLRRSHNKLPKPSINLTASHLNKLWTKNQTWIGQTFFMSTTLVRNFQCIQIVIQDLKLCMINGWSQMLRWCKTWWLQGTSPKKMVARMSTHCKLPFCQTRR